MTTRFRSSLYVILFFAYTNCEGQNVTYFMNEDAISSLSINGVAFTELTMPDTAFSELSPLGKPKNIENTKSFVEEVWYYHFDGLTLSYSNVNGYPELFEMELTGSKFNIVLGGKRFAIGGNMKEVFLSNNAADLARFGLLSQDGSSTVSIIADADGAIKQLRFRQKD